MSDKQNEQGVIAWHLVAKNLIKFDGHDDSYKLSDKVIAASDFAKFPLKKGDKVSFEVKDKVVTYLRKEATAKKEEPKATEEAPVGEPYSDPKPEVKTETYDSQELTVYSVAGTKKVVKFTSKDTQWVTVSPELQAQDFNVIGLVGKKRVKATIKNNVLVAVEPSNTTEPASEPAKQAQEAPSQAQVPETTTSTPVTEKDAFYRVKELERTVRFLESNKQASIEAQASVNGANELVGRIASTLEAKPPASTMIAMITAIAEANYELIQKLKAKTS